MIKVNLTIDFPSHFDNEISLFDILLPSAELLKVFYDLCRIYLSATVAVQLKVPMQLKVPYATTGRLIDCRHRYTGMTLAFSAS